MGQSQWFFFSLGFMLFFVVLAHARTLPLSHCGTTLVLMRPASLPSSLSTPLPASSSLSINKFAPLYFFEQMLSWDTMEGGKKGKVTRHTPLIPNHRSFFSATRQMLNGFSRRQKLAVSFFHSRFFSFLFFSSAILSLTSFSFVYIASLLHSFFSTLSFLLFPFLLLLPLFHLTQFTQ
jgi:hypothetical protein